MCQDFNDEQEIKQLKMAQIQKTLIDLILKDPISYINMYLDLLQYKCIAI